METSPIEQRIKVTVAEILAHDPAFLENFPIEDYLMEYKKYSGIHGYGHISLGLREAVNKISRTFSIRMQALYHKLALFSLLWESVEYLKSANIPENISNLYRSWFNRVMDDSFKRPDQFYCLENDSFLKDLAVCNLRMIPVGVALVEVSGIRKKMLLRGTLQQFINAMLLILYRTKGFGPFYVMHTDRRHMKEFSAQGWSYAYRNIAELLKTNPNVKGVVGSSWYYDPFLQIISPELAFLADVPIKNGAKIYRVGTSESDIKNATSWSPTRMVLYKEGRYIPTCHLLIWPRKELMEWERKTRE